MLRNLLIVKGLFVELILTKSDQQLKYEFIQHFLQQRTAPYLSSADPVFVLGLTRRLRPIKRKDRKRIVNLFRGHQNIIQE